MIDIVLADGGVGYYYTNNVVTSWIEGLVILVGLFILTMGWNWGIIKLLNLKRQKRNLSEQFNQNGEGNNFEFFSWRLLSYTMSVFILEFIAYVFLVSYPYIASLISILIIMLFYFFIIDKNWLKAFLMSILANPIWVYLLLTWLGA